MPLPQSSFLGYDDQYQRPDLYTSHAITANGAGSAVANLPVTNLLDPSMARVWSRVGVQHAQTVQVDILTTVNANASEGTTASAVIVVGPYAVRQGTGERHRVNVRCQVGNFAQTVFVYDGGVSTFSGYGFSSGRALNSFPFIFSGRDESVAGLQDRARGGTPITAGGAVQSVRLLFTMPTTPSGTFDLFCQRVMLVRGFWCTTSDDFIVNYLDDSEVIRSFSGFAYPVRRPVRTQVNAQILRIDQKTAFGGIDENFNFVRSSIHAVNRVAGRSAEVVFVPRLQDSPVNGVTALSTENQSDANCIVGLMDAPIAISHAAPVSGPLQALYTGQLSITSSSF